MYPIAYWPEDVFLGCYALLFLVMFVASDLMKFRSDYVRPIARWGIGGTVAVLAIAHLLTDLGTARINQHWTGRAPSATNYNQHSALINSKDYRTYWGEDRRGIPFYSNKHGHRLALLPYLFLVTFIASQIYFRQIR